MIGGLLVGYFPLEAAGAKNLQATCGGKHEELEPRCPETVTRRIWPSPAWHPGGGHLYFRCLES